jgi:hypothetical protein
MKPSAAESHLGEFAMDFPLALQDPGGVALKIVPSGESPEDLPRAALTSYKVEEREPGAGVTKTETTAVQPLQEEAFF